MIESKVNKYVKEGEKNLKVNAVWYSSDLSSTYTGKVVVITDINYNSHSSYYTNNNKNWMNAMRTMLATNYSTGVAITSSQTTTLNAAINTYCNVHHIFVHRKMYQLENYYLLC